MSALRSVLPGPFDNFDLDALVSGAARLRPERLALTDATNTTLTFASLDQQTSALAGALKDLGLQPGQRVLISAAATTRSVVALFASLRAGLDVVMAPLHLTTEELQILTHETQPSALLAEARHGDLCPVDALFVAAAATPSVKLVGSLWGHVEGAADLDPALLDQRPRLPSAGRTTMPRLITRASDNTARSHEQRLLISAALDLVSRARIGMRQPVLTTLSPTSLAGLVAGPVATLLAGAPLILHAPFDSDIFLQAISDNAPLHLMMPLAMETVLFEAGCLDRERIRSLCVFTRDAYLPERTHSSPVPVIALQANADDTSLAICVYDIGLMNGGAAASKELATT